MGTGQGFQRPRGAAKTLAAGESIGAEGALPLSVIIGNASGTEVRVRGELLEVAKTTRDNVARFEVK